MTNELTDARQTAHVAAAGDLPLIHHWIDGAPDLRGSATDVWNPALGRPVRRVLLGGDEVVNAAVAAAVRAADSWSQVPIPKRVGFLRDFRELICAHRDELLDLISEEHGKVRADALGEFMRGVEVVDHACAAATLLTGSYSDQVATGVDVFSMRVPLGVAAGITPFNFPAMVPLWMFPVALAAGNTFVLKPSERDPSAPTRLAELASEAGLPPGVLNVVHGDKTSVDRICDHPGIASVSFVGSTPVASYVYQRATAAGKRAQALGGAKNHLVVMPDSDIDFAADAATSAAYGSTGQRCMAISTVVAVGRAADPLVAAMQQRMSMIRIGPATDPEADMGPLVSAVARDRTVDAVAGAATAGAVVVVDGRDVSVSGHKDGFFVGPTLIDHVGVEMEVYREEIFGPVLIVVRVNTLDEAIALINANPYGNGAAIATSSGGAARHFQRMATAGMIGVNVPIPVPVAFHSFGGWKQSLFGDRHLYGKEGFDFYTRGKVVTARWPEQSAGINLSFPG